MQQDFITMLRDLDPWQFMAGLFLILWVVEVRFGGRAKATKESRMEAMIRGYDMCVRQMHEAEMHRAEGEGYLP